MRDFGNRACHLLVYEAWIGPRDPKMQIDHIDSDSTNYAASNLEQVTASENNWRSNLTQVLLSKGIRTADYDAKGIHHWFDIGRHLDTIFPTVRHWQTFTKEDYLRFYSMPFKEFQQMWKDAGFIPSTPEQAAARAAERMEYDMTHHVE